LDRTTNRSGTFRTAFPGLLALFLAVGVCLHPPRPAGAADGKELLAHIGLNAVERNYLGDKVVIDFSRMTPQVTRLSVLHQTGGKERRVYQASDSVVVIDGDYFYQYYPKKRVLVKKKLPGEGGYESLQRENLKQTLVSYELRNSPSEAVAGRPTRLYEFVPIHAGTRPLRKVWVDVETGLFLRMEIYSPDDKLILLSAFEKISFQPEVTPASFTMEVPSGVRVVETEEGGCLEPDAAGRVAGFPVGLPDYLPGGFVRKCIRARKVKSFSEVQVLYSDGLSLLSLFQSSQGRLYGKEGPGRSTVRVGDRDGSLYKLGLVSALSWKASWAHLTILGEMSQEEMLKVAESVHPLRELSRP